jgi:DNA topoisomerase-3
MNATRAYTLRFAKGVGKDRQVLSIGRVQTPTLALIVKRQHEIDNFVPRTYWELKTNYRDTIFSAQIPVEEDEYAITSLEQGQKLVDSIKDLPLEISSVEKKKGMEYAPRLFDLTSLQVECNKRYGLSADDTLKIIQSLYEKHVTTYPRVDTTFLSDDIYPKVPATLQGIKEFFPQVAPLLPLKADGGKGVGSLPKSKKVFDNSKVTDHHAIIPTGQRPNNLTDLERKVYDMVALRFIAAFYPPCQVSTTTVLAQAGDIQFKVTGREILEQGWREVFAKETTSEPSDTSEPSEQKALPSFKKGESGPHEPQLQEKTTTPPKFYTEATLLRAMETAGKTVDNEELRDAMKENGIGRPSTRAAIIEKLFQRKYIVREKKNIKATEVGINLIHTIISPLLKSAELTGLWEKKLREIERGDFAAQQFLDELKQMTSEVVREVKLDKSGMRCPICGRGTIIRGRTRYGCSRWREGCTYAEQF